jgi:hypothetical protein
MPQYTERTSGPPCHQVPCTATLLWASAPQNSQTAAHWPTKLPLHRPTRPPFSSPSDIHPEGPLGLCPAEQCGHHQPPCQATDMQTHMATPCWAHWATAQPGFCHTDPPDHCPPTSMPHRLLPTTGFLQHHQTLAPNLPRRCRQTRLYAKGVTPELLRLKFYCSRTRIFFFLFSLFFKCLFVLLSI